MLEQLLVAYVVGMIAAIVLEVGRIMKARRLNRAAALNGAIAQAAPSFPGMHAISHNAAAAPAANEPALTRLAG